jgi:hypothetical protein
MVLSKKEPFSFVVDLLNFRYNNFNLKTFTTVTSRIFFFLVVVTDFLEFIRSVPVDCRMLRSPAQSSNASTPTRPRTRSVTSKEDYLSNPEKLNFLMEADDYGQPLSTSQSFVNGDPASMCFIGQVNNFLGTESQFDFDNIARRTRTYNDNPVHSQNSDCVFVGKIQLQQL